MPDKHTQAPWEAIKDKHGMDGGHQLIAIMGGDDSDRRILITSANEGCQTANQNLIKAAPDLLESLKDMLIYATNQRNRFMSGQDMQILDIDFIDGARLAINKAKGK
jgi:hypothetical protein